jgi:uncharacterized membrane protein
MLISSSVVGFVLVESFMEKNRNNDLHTLSLNFSKLARLGGVFALLTGIYSWVEEGGLPGWLLVKAVLFVWFIVSGVIVGAKYFSTRGKILSGGEVASEELTRINRTIKNYSYINLVVFVLIVFLAVFKPF